MPTGNGGQEGVYALEQVGNSQALGQSIHQPQTGSLLAAQQTQKPRLAGQPVELRLPSIGPARLPVRGQPQFDFDAVHRAGTSQR